VESGKWKVESGKQLRCFHHAGFVIGFDYLAAIEVAAPVSDVQFVALTEAQHPHGVAALLGIEGAESIRGNIFTIK
jgi:hypothetical protein